MESVNRRQRKVFKTADPEELDGKKSFSYHDNLFHKSRKLNKTFHVTTCYFVVSFSLA